MERDFAPQFLRSNLVVLTNERSARPAEALAAIPTARRFEKDRPLEARQRGARACRAALVVAQQLDPPLSSSNL
jgi:hypothetical protein